MNAFRAIYRIWVSILTAAVALQIFFAGYGAFDAAKKLDDEGSTIDQDAFNASFDPHIALGYFLFLGSLVLLLISFGARGKSRTCARWLSCSC
jgi:H+/Cl- antiporter ClcA